MQNCDISIENNVLILKISLDEEYGFTRSLYSVKIGSSNGNVQLWENGKPHPKGIKFNVNVFRVLSDEEKAEAKQLRRSIW